jgi:hypothetical protein
MKFAKKSKTGRVDAKGPQTRNYYKPVIFILHYFQFVEFCVMLQLYNEIQQFKSVGESQLAR